MVSDVFVSRVSKSHHSFFFFLYLHSRHIVAKISALIPSANNPRILLPSLEGSQVYIVLRREEADEHSLIKMFLLKCEIPLWRGEKRKRSLRVRVRRRGVRKREEIRDSSIHAPSSSYLSFTHTPTSPSSRLGVLPDSLL